MTTKEEYEELAKEMTRALNAASTIRCNILGPGRILEKEDYRAIATSLFIQAYKNKNGNSGNYEGPVTESQIKFLRILGEEREGAAAVIRQFLDTNGLITTENMSSSKASTLIDMLKELPKRK